MMTPEPSDCSMRSRAITGMPKNCPKNVSSINGLRTRTRVLELMLTTAGMTLASIGASDGNGWPPTATGKVPAAPVSGRAQAHKAKTAKATKTAPNMGIRRRIDMVKSSKTNESAPQQTIFAGNGFVIVASAAGDTGDLFPAHGNLRVWHENSCAIH